jgi:hypothetical protein
MLDIWRDQPGRPMTRAEMTAAMTPAPAAAMTPASPGREGAGDRASRVRDPGCARALTVQTTLTAEQEAALLEAVQDGKGNQDRG